jgi:hypothetical protein
MVTETGAAPLRARHRAPIAKNAVVPKVEALTVEQQWERDLARQGTGRCRICGWSFTGSMSEVIEAQAAHREVEHPEALSHPDVLRRSRNAKRQRAKLAERRAKSATVRKRPVEHA